MKMLWTNLSQQADKEHTCIPELISDLQLKLKTRLSIEPFDEIHDEDALNATYDKIKILNNDIDNALKQTPLVYKTLYELMNKKQETEKHLDDLLLERAVKYAEWKKQVMQLTDEKLKLSDQIKELRSIDVNVKSLLKSWSRVDSMVAVKFHNMINTLLKLSGYQKENTPYAAFTSAFNKGLIDKTLYKRLAKNYK